MTAWSPLARVAPLMLMLVACVPGPSDAVTGSPTATTSVVSPSPTPSRASSATPSAAPTSDPTAAAFFKTLTTGWRPTTTTLIVSEVVPIGQAAQIRLVAVPADGSAATPLVSLGGGPTLAIRADGSAVAAAVGGGVAVWHPSGVARWIVPPDLSTAVNGLVWSPDGATLYFGRFKTPQGAFGQDLGLFRVRADGSGLEKVLGPEPAGAGPPTTSVLRMVTADGVLVWGRAYEGASVETFDLATGRKRTYDDGVADVVAWRSTQPRALIQHCNYIDCRGLVEWNDETGAKRDVLPASAVVGGADREPAGSTIVVARRTDTWGLDLIDGGVVARIPGTTNAQWPRWLSQGIAYLWGPAAGGFGAFPLPDLRIVAATGGASRTLYRAGEPGGSLFVIQIVLR